jgi:hypothetical protein
MDWVPLHPQDKREDFVLIWVGTSTPTRVFFQHILFGAQGNRASSVPPAQQTNAAMLIWPENSNGVRFEVLTAVTMKNVVFWDITTQFVLHRRHITSPL